MEMFWNFCLLAEIAFPMLDYQKRKGSEEKLSYRNLKFLL